MQAAQAALAAAAPPPGRPHWSCSWRHRWRHPESIVRVPASRQQLLSDVYLCLCNKVSGPAEVYSMMMLSARRQSVHDHVISSECSLTSVGWVGIPR